MQEIFDYLKYMVSTDASDIYITAGPYFSFYLA